MSTHTPEETTENEFSEFSDNQKKTQLITHRGKNHKSHKKDPSPEQDKQKQEVMQRNLPITIKYNNFFVRTLWTIVMLVGYIAILNAGHFYVSCLVFLLNVGIVREIFALKRNFDKEIKIPLFYLINWYFFAVAIFFFYGKLFSSKLTRYVLNPENYAVRFVVQYHNFISFMLWIAGFLLFVLSLRKGYYRYQFRFFGWTHITLILIVAQSSALIQNTYEGLVWFILPSLLVITNDIMAYIFGIAFGRTKLIELSPKKTWEGFIGGSVATLFMAFLLASQLQKYDSLICPVDDLLFTPFARATCETPLVFQLRQHQTFLGTIWYSDFQIHAMVLSLFASLIAPFGGFFASGFKRGLKIKDFADVIPGHGGITDRMDCQILTGMFSYLYLHQIVQSRMYSTYQITELIVNMAPEDQLLIYKELQKILSQQQII